MAAIFMASYTTHGDTIESMANGAENRCHFRFGVR